MGGQTTSSSATSSSSESSQQGMEKFQHLSLHQPPPPRPTHSKGKKHHRHRQYHSCPSPPSSSGHHRRRVSEHTPLGRPHHRKLPPFMGCPDHHQYHREGELRNTPKHLKKVHKLHRKIMKAYKLPKSARHGAHQRHPMYFPPHEEGIYGAPFSHPHPPGCCLHNSEAIEGLSVVQGMSFRHHHHPRCHGRYPHPRRPSCILNKSDDAGGKLRPQAVETSAEPPIEGGTMPLTSDITPWNEPVPAIQGP